MTIPLYFKKYESKAEAKRAYDAASGTLWGPEINPTKIAFEVWESDKGWIVAAIGFDASPLMLPNGEPISPDEILDDEGINTLRAYGALKAITLALKQEKGVRRPVDDAGG